MICVCVCVCVRAHVEDEMGRGEVGVSMRVPSGFLLSSLCVTLARDGSLSTVLPVPLNITHTHTHAQRQKQTNRGWQILDMNICNMTCAWGEKSVSVCLCVCLGV